MQPTSWIPVLWFNEPCPERIFKIETSIKCKSFDILYLWNWLGKNIQLQNSLHRKDWVQGLFAIWFLFYIFYVCPCFFSSPHTYSHTILKQIIILLISETPSATACTPPLFIKVSYLGQITSNSWISNYFELLSIIYLSIGSNSFLNYPFFFKYYADVAQYKIF